MMVYRTVNPTTGRTMREFATSTDDDVSLALEASDNAYRMWRTVPVVERASTLARVATIYEERRDYLAELAGMEMGKPVAQAKSEIDMVSSIFRYYADHGPEFLREEYIDVVGGGTAAVQNEPTGSLLGIMPWNYPYYQVARFAAPNLVLGNTIILKHAPNCPQSALAIVQIFRDAGLPSGAYVNLFATNGQVARIIADRRNKGVSLTGSEEAGSAIAQVAGRNLKKCVLELGGSDAFIVLDTHDIETVARTAAAGRMSNAGQACNAPKRLIVNSEIYDRFLPALVRHVNALVVGDPTDARTAVGPMSSRAAVDHLLRQIDDAVKKGAKVHAGGERIRGRGAFMQPTVLSGVKPGMLAYTEEVFGPVAVVYSVNNDEEALHLANDSPYGLGCSVWCENVTAARSIANRLEVGMVWINGLEDSQADLPFGGTKRSGFGRELGKYGIEEFANRKLIRVLS